MKFFRSSDTFRLPPGTYKVLIVVICFFGIVVPLFIQILILLQQSTIKDETIRMSQNVLYEQMEIKKEKMDSLEKHLKELNDIKIKALNSLVGLDAQRVRLQREIAEANKGKEELKKEERYLRRSIEKAKKELKDLNQQAPSRKVVTNILYVGKPQEPNFQMKSMKKLEINFNQQTCNFHTCFDHSKCSILKRFTFHVFSSSLQNFNSFYKMVTSLRESSSDWITSCVNIVLLDLAKSAESIHKYLSEVPSMKQTYSNHLLFLLGDDNNYCEKVNLLEVKHAVLVTDRICPGFRRKYDFILPNFHTSVTAGIIPAPLYPAKREHLLFFASEFLKEDVSDLDDEGYLLQFHSEADNVYINRTCYGSFVRKCSKGTWCICNPDQNRVDLLQNSLFTLIIIDVTNSFFFDEIVDAFKSGSIPVLIGEIEYLPFSDVIDWKLAVVIIPSQRLPELTLLLKNMPFNDMISLKLQGNFLYSAYFSSKETMTKTLLTYLRNKIGLPSMELMDFQASLLFKGKATDQFDTPTVVYTSAQFKNNYSSIGKHQHLFWNRYPGSLNLYPVTPWNEAPPSRIQFLEEGRDYYMPIGDGTGGDGVAFARSLGGDYPVEEFTIVMLTYDREAILMESLQRLSGMKYLNKVVVVWNHPIDPASDLEWPNIGVKLEVIRAGKNSLNNRFIPYDVVETEAILSMDDDIYLRHDEIELAFRVWRENRDRLVGFPGRHHSYNSSSNSFYYNALHSCELSLVLTGGAFFHKYYSYVYTYNMNPKIRQIVDNLMNCEDIAMNFLVAHIIKKPPIKVTSRWTFRCPECPVALSTDAHHFEERHTCMASFEQLYGYNPLKRTQFRADSILFKTRIPQNMKKCFQFV